MFSFDAGKVCGLYLVYGGSFRLLKRNEVSNMVFGKQETTGVKFSICRETRLFSRTESGVQLQLDLLHFEVNLLEWNTSGILLVNYFL